MSFSPPFEFTSSPLAESTGQESYPVTPKNNVRSRFSASDLRMAGDYISGSNVSPTSTFSEGSPYAYASRAVFRGVMSTTPAGTPPRRKVVIRTDPALVTCFDPSDKELYDLWVPRK